MGQKNHRVGVWFYKPHIAAELTIKQLKPDVTAKTQKDPLDILLVKDITHSPVFTVDEDATVDIIAQLMNEHELDYISVTTQEGNPIGIVTERDLVTKVLIKNVKPSKLAAKDVMTSPIVTTDPEFSIREVAKQMSQLRIGKLGVIYKGNLVGIISNNDIVALLPKMTGIVQEMPTISLVRF